MSDFSFFWHDYETFGAVPKRDRPAQFAGVRTDVELNEIGPPVMHFCQPAPDFLPEPEACLLTGILPQDCLAKGVPEHQFAAAIEKALGQPGTVGVGYNSIRFDDEVTRHLFWRNLIDPYAREYKNGCARWDLLDTVRCMYALRPEGLQWPTHPDSRPSFKLEDLTRANGLAHEAAHDALSDVRATIGLARLVRQAQPRLWAFCLKLRHKEAVWAEIQSAQQAGQPFLHISGMFSPERGCMAAVWPLALHPTNKNELIVWDLAHDPAELFGLDAAQIRERLFVRSADLPEGVQRLPIKTIHANKSPVVIGQMKTLPPAMAERWGLDLELTARHARACAEGAEHLQALWPDVFRRPPKTAGEAVDVDEDLYGGFLKDADRGRLDRLRLLPPGDPRLARASFDDPRLEELVFRYRARNAPASLSEEEESRWETWRSARLHEGAGGALSVPDYLEKLDVLAAKADERGLGVLSALSDYLEEIAPPLD
jgi:exodeoxyribonuclease-1